MEVTSQPDRKRVNIDHGFIFHKSCIQSTYKKGNTAVGNVLALTQRNIEFRKQMTLGNNLFGLYQDNGRYVLQHPALEAY